MPQQFIGNTSKPLTSLVWMNGGVPEITEADDGKYELSFEVMCETASLKTLKPARGDAPPSPWDTRYPGVKFRSLGAVSHGRPGPNVSIVKLIYRTPSPLTFPPSTLEQVRSVTASAIEKSIDEHPSLTDTQKLAAKSNGRNSYLQATVRYSYTDSDASFGWTQTEIVGSVGSTEAPTGMVSATAARWLHDQREITEMENGDVSIRDSWLYDENEWQPGSY